MNGQKRASVADKMVNVVICIVIIAFVVVGVYATYGKISEGIEDRAIANGEKEATVAYLAKQGGMTVDEYLAQYGLSIGDVINEKTTESEMTDNMTVENYLKYSGDTQTAEEVINGVGLQDKVTKDTLWKDFMPQVPVVSILGEEQFNQIKTQMELGDDVTPDMPYGDFEKLLESKQAEASNAEGEAETGEVTAEPENGGEEAPAPEAE